DFIVPFPHLRDIDHIGTPKYSRHLVIDLVGTDRGPRLRGPEAARGAADRADRSIRILGQPMQLSPAEDERVGAQDRVHKGAAAEARHIYGYEAGAALDLGPFAERYNFGDRDAE